MPIPKKIVSKNHQKLFLTVSTWTTTTQRSLKPITPRKPNLSVMLFRTFCQLSSRSEFTWRFGTPVICWLVLGLCILVPPSTTISSLSIMSMLLAKMKKYGCTIHCSWFPCILMSWCRPYLGYIV